MVEDLVRHVSRNDHNLALPLLKLPDDHALCAQRLHVAVVQPLVAGQQEVHAVPGSLRVRVGELELQVHLHMVPELGMYGSPPRRPALRVEVDGDAIVMVHVGVTGALIASASAGLARRLALLYEGHPQP
jgi:hypothetical protein